MLLSSDLFPVIQSAAEKRAIKTAIIIQTLYLPKHSVWINYRIYVNKAFELIIVGFIIARFSATSCILSSDSLSRNHELNYVELQNYPLV